MGVVIYIKHSPDYDSEYIYIGSWSWSSSLSSSVSAEIPFLSYTGKGRGVARWDPAHVT